MTASGAVITPQGVGDRLITLGFELAGMNRESSHFAYLSQNGQTVVHVPADRNVLIYEQVEVIAKQAGVSPKQLIP